MKHFEELFKIADALKNEGATETQESISAPLSSLEDAVEFVARSFSGSWLGYHSRVYYQYFSPPPAGAHFSQEWGLEDMSFTSLGSRGDWQEYSADEVKLFINKRAGNPSIEIAQQAAAKATHTFDRAKSEITSLLETELEEKPDQFLSKLKDELEKLKPLTRRDVAERLQPKGQFVTRDMVAMGQGITIPPHTQIGANITSIRLAFEICRMGAELAIKAASHLERKSRRNVAAARIGTNVFIGHGRSPLWRELKDFVQDRLKLPWDEFNRVPVAGVTNIARLSEMLDSAAIAFLVLTAEDEMADTTMQARMNVVHEAGLFQGRLGFVKAIVLLEEGCSEFSNIQGLGQIRFPKGNIAASFEQVRQVLEREGLIEESEK